MPFSQMIHNVLYIEDDEGLARLLQKRLERSNINVTLVTNAEDGEKIIRNSNYDVILVDYYLPGMSGLDLIHKLAHESTDTPIILLTASGSERIAVDALEAGAADYIVKDTGQFYIDLLPSVMAAAYTRVRLAKELQKQQTLLLDYARKLKESEQRLNLAVEGSQIGIWDWNLLDNTLFWSVSLLKSHGMSVTDTPTVEIWKQNMHPEDVLIAQRAVDDHVSGKTAIYNVIYREINSSSQHDQDWQWTHARGIALRDGEGIPYRMLGSCMDITIQKRLEVQLEFEKSRAESANQAKSEFLATMSHEIRTPMNAVVGLAGLLEKTELSERQHEMVQTLHSNAVILLKIINDLLDISRIESGQMTLEEKPFLLSEVLNDIKSMFNEVATNKNLKFDINNNIPDVHFLGDASRIHQVLMNLCGNALKFTEQGSVSITASRDPQTHDLLLSIADTGIGISEDKLAEIFDKFVQADQSISRRFGGSGLGLSICRTLVTMMDGTITAKSKDDAGSIFIVRLPLREHQAESTSIDLLKQSIILPKAENIASQLSNTKPILLVEDYAANIMVATMLLEELGYSYHVAESGTKAIEAVTGTINPYLAILMDVQMPGMDGFEATRRIREWEQAHNIPPHHIIGLTAHALAGDRERCIKAGMNDYMTKPIQPDILKEKLEFALVAGG